MRKIILTISMALLPAEVLAKKIADYVPPPYFERVLMSMIALLPIAFIFGFILYVCHFKFDSITSKNRKVIWCRIIFVLVFIGSILAGLDSMNDELWNPALIGGLIVAMMAPVSFFVLNHKLSLVVKGISSIISYPIFIAIIVVLTGIWTYYGTGLVGYMFGWRLAW